VLIKLLIYTFITGSIYCIIASGFSLVFGVSGIMNLAHGVYYMIAGYFLYTFFVATQSMALAIPLAILCTTLFGVVSYFVIYRVIDSPFKTLLATFAIGGAIAEIIFILYGVTTYGIPNIIEGSFIFWGVPVIKQALVAALVALLILSVFVFLLNKTDIGRAMRSVAQNEQVAKLAGININQIRLVTITSAAFLASIAGVFYLPLQALNPTMWMNITIISFVIVVMGGMGNLKGVVASYIIAFCEYATILSFPEGSYIKNGVYLLLMIMILMMRPQGLFGKNIGPFEV
jgi:branched-chain amino acid transport system permease protein